VKNLKEVLAEKQNDGFELFITGHSLGGALCQLLSYELASYSEIGENDPFPLPIRAISFASPQIGNKEGFAQAYQALEKAGRVRHLRVTNEGDAVPEAPFGFGYAQTGVKVHVKENEPAEVGYNIVMNIVRQIGFDSGEMHKLSNYQKHLFNSENKELLKETIDQLYQNEAGIEAPQASLVAK
jgi:putative lipase involved disintegration of autophagic bodies